MKIKPVEQENRLCPDMLDLDVQTPSGGLKLLLLNKVFITTRICDKLAYLNNGFHSVSLCIPNISIWKPKY